MLFAKRILISRAVNSSHSADLRRLNVIVLYILIVTDGRSSRNGSRQLSSSSSNRESSLLDSSQSQSVSMPPSLKSSQSISSSHKPEMTEEEFTKALNKIVKDYLENLELEVSFSMDHLFVSIRIIKLNGDQT